MNREERTFFSKVQGLFQELCDLPHDEQAARLREEDTAMRHEVEALLEMDSTPQVPLDQSRNKLHEPPGAERPKWVGSYEILAELGSGGMGIVYEARQPTPRRTVALKLIHPGFITPERFQRFRREAEALGSLNHPGIAQVYEAGTAPTSAGELPYIAMELVRGESLERYARHAGLGITEILELVARLGDAVHHAHRRGVVHRDLKPGNVLVTEDGTPKILDFGVARIGETEARTRTGQLVGTLAYMSPEQVRADLGPVDRRTDVYALGVMAYELLTGSRPNDVDSQSLPEAARAIVEDEALPLGRIDRRLRGDIEIIVDKAIAKEKERRYESAAALAADLRRFLSDKPIRARPDSKIYLLRKFTRRHKGVVAGVATAFLAMAMGTAVALWQAGEAEAARIDADRERQAARIEAYRGTLAAAQATLEVGNVKATVQALQRIPEVERGWEWRYVRSQLDQAEAVVAGLDSVAAALDQQGRLVTVSADGNLSWVDPHLGDVIRVEPLGAGSLRSAALSGDGRRVAMVHGPDARALGVWELDADQGIAKVLDVRLEQEGQWVVVSAAGETVAVTGAETAWIFQQGADPIRWAHGLNPEDLTINAEGTRVGLVGSTDVPGVYRLFDVGAGRATSDLGRDLVSLALSPDGLMALASETDGVVRLRDAESGRVLFRLMPPHDALRFAAIDTYARQVAAVGTDGAVRLWSIDPAELMKQGGEGADRDSQPAIVLPGHTAAIRSVSFDPSGAKLITADANGEVRICDVEAARGPRSLIGGIVDFSLSPDGSRIVAGNDAGDLLFWSGASTALYGDLPLEVRYSTLRISADGTLLAAAERGNIDLRKLAHPVDAVRLFSGEHEVLALSFSADGRLAALDAGGVLRVWEVSSRREILEVALDVDATTDLDLVFSPSGELLAAAKSGLQVLAADSGRAVFDRHVAGARPLAVSWLPQTRTAVSGWSDGVIRLFDMETETRTELSSANGAILSLAPFPDGRRLGAGTAQGVVEIWDLETERSTLELHEAGASRLSVTPDGTGLVSLALSRILVFDTAPVQERLARAAAEASLSESLRNLVLEHFATSADPIAVAERLWRDRSLSERDRRAALRKTLDVSAPDTGLKLDPFDGHAIGFPGRDQHVLAGGDERNLRMGAAFTVELWVRPLSMSTVPSESSRQQTVLCKEGEYQIAIGPTPGVLAWIVAGPDGWTEWISTRYSAPRDQWTHIALVRDGSEIRFLVNGRLVQTVEGPIRVGDHTTVMNELRIGGRQHTASGFVGEIDEVRIWSTARSEREIIDGMQRAIGADEPGLTAAWSFDEGRGTTTRDLTGRHDGTLVGAQWRATRRQD